MISHLLMQIKMSDNVIISVKEECSDIEIDMGDVDKDPLAIEEGEAG